MRLFLCSYHIHILYDHLIIEIIWRWISYLYVHEKSFEICSIFNEFFTSIFIDISNFKISNIYMTYNLYPFTEVNIVTPLIAVLIGIIGSLVFSAIAVIIAVTVKSCRSNHGSKGNKNFLCTFNFSISKSILWMARKRRTFHSLQTQTFHSFQLLLLQIEFCLFKPAKRGEKVLKKFTKFTLFLLLLRLSLNSSNFELFHFFPSLRYIPFHIYMCIYSVHRMET